MNNITVRPDNHRTDIRFSRSIKEPEKGYETTLKELLTALKVRNFKIYFKECDATIYFILNTRLSLKNRNNLERKLCDVCGLNYQQHINMKSKETKKINSEKPKIIHNETFISGYSGCPITGDGFEWRYERAEPRRAQSIEDFV